MKRAIILMGPPGAGKGTQAELLAYKFGLIHFDTGRYIEGLHREKLVPLKIRKEFERGDLADPVWALKVLRKQIERIASADFGVALSGSPRTVFEAFGDSQNIGVMTALTRAYGKQNISVFELDIPQEATILRNSKRRVCSVCWKTHLLGPALRNCPFCGGKLIRRVQDRPSIIKHRLEEYKERTKPVLKKMKAAGFKVVKINGRSKPVAVFNKINGYLK